MPPRWFSLLIIAGWLSMTGWLVWSELRTHFEADEQPSFVPDLVDEAQPERSWISWRVYLEGRARGGGPNETFTARTVTEITEKPDIQYTLRFRFEPHNAVGDVMDLGDLRLRRINSLYRIDQKGRLLALETDIAFDQKLPLTINKWMEIAFALNGEVRDGMFRSRFEAAAGEKEMTGELPAVPLQDKGSVLLPLHPLNKLSRLRLGQTWRMPIVNPMADALSAYVGVSSEPRRLVARVRPNYEMLPDEDKDIPCLVIDYEEEGDGEKSQPRTWVRAVDGLVLRQEATLNGKRLVMHRLQIPDPLE
jgi:hypothetical protein